MVFCCGRRWGRRLPERRQSIEAESNRGKVAGWVAAAQVNLLELPDKVLPAGAQSASGSREWIARVLLAAALPAVPAAPIGLSTTGGEAAAAVHPGSINAPLAEPHAIRWPTCSSAGSGCIVG